MGFFGLIQATELEAHYDNTTKQLILIARGSAVCYTTAITFQRQQFLGGLKFALNGWVGPITGATQPYEYEMKYPIELPNLEIFPTNSVIILTANDPKGRTVEINYFSSEVLPAETSDETSTKASGTTTTTPNDGQQLLKIFTQPFDISASAEISTPLGTVSVDFDKNFLTLTNASITSGDKITWTFDSLQTGDTQILVITRGGGGTEIMSTVVYDLKIVLPRFIPRIPLPIHPAMIKSLDAPASDPTDGPIPVDNPTKPPHIPLKWLGFVNIGIKLLEAAYPLGIQLLEVEATPLVPGPVTNPLQLNQLKIVASVNIGPEFAHNTAIIKSTGWGEFGAIETYPAPWLGDVVITWPIEMDIVQSFKLLQDAGFTDPVENMTLRQPLYPGVEEPYYIYGFASGLFVAVGVNDGVVRKFGSGNLGFLDLAE